MTEGSGPPENFALPLEQPRMIGLAEPGSRLDQSIQDSLQVERRATDGVQHFCSVGMFLQRVPLFRFSVFEFTDVGNGTDQPQLSPIGVSDGGGTVAYPTPLAGLVENAIFAREVRHVPFEIGDRRITIPGPIVGMDALQPI